MVTGLRISATERAGADLPGGDFSIGRPEQIAIAARDPINDIPGVAKQGVSMRATWMSPIRMSVR